jgi:hypothetical protein
MHDGAMNKLRTILAVLIALLSPIHAHCAQSSPQSITVRGTLDINMKRGTTDRFGDTKAVQTVYRNGPWALGLDFAIKTPPAKHHKIQFDTATATALAGYETSDWSIYGAVGMLNGPALNTARSMLLKCHKLMGMKTLRTSPASSNFRLAMELMARYDVILPPVQIKKLKIQGTITPYARLSSVDTKAGLAVFAVMPFGDSVVLRQDVPALPALAPSGNFVRFGIISEFHGYSVSTDRVGRNRADASIVAGIGLEYGHWNLTADALFPVTAQVSGQLGNPIPEVSLSLTRKF